MAKGVIHRDGDWLAARVGDDVVMMSAHEGAFLRLSGVGGRIWELIEQPRTAHELRTMLLAEYDVSAEECGRAIDDFVASLVKRRAVRIDSHP